MRLAADRHLVLLHDLEQGRLHLRRRTVDLVGEEEVAENRAELGVEAVAGAIDAVPTRSEGTRSGVNWMRRNVPPRTSASVFTVSVLARPGTPSIRTCPPESSATRTRSSIRSCPTITRLISKSVVSSFPRTPVKSPAASVGRFRLARGCERLGSGWAGAASVGGSGWLGGARLLAVWLGAANVGASG